MATPAPSRPAVPTSVPHLCAAFKTSCRAISSAQTTAPPSSTAAPTASTRRQPKRICRTIHCASPAFSSGRRAATSPPTRTTPPFRSFPRRRPTWLPSRLWSTATSPSSTARASSRQTTKRNTTPMVIVIVVMVMLIIMAVRRKEWKAVISLSSSTTFDGIARH